MDNDAYQLKTLPKMNAVEPPNVSDQMCSLHTNTAKPFAIRQTDLSYGVKSLDKLPLMMPIVNENEPYLNQICTKVVVTTMYT